MASENQTANIEREVRESAERFNAALACADAADLSVRWSMVSAGGENNTVVVKGVERRGRYGRDGDLS